MVRIGVRARDPLTSQVAARDQLNSLRTGDIVLTRPMHPRENTMAENFEIPVQIRDADGNVGTVIGATAVFMGGNPASFIATGTLVGYGAPGPGQGPVRVMITGEPGLIEVGGGNSPGEVRLLDGAGNRNIQLEAAGARATLGGGGTSGEATLIDAFSTPRVSMTADNAQLRLLNAIGEPGTVLNGEGNLSLTDVVGNNTIALNALNARIDVGTGVILDGARGAIRVTDASNTPKIVLDAVSGSTIGGGLTVVGPFNHSGDRTVNGTFTVNGDVVVSGDVLLTRADCAEEFPVSESQLCEPGTVMVLNEQGLLEESTKPYDRAVAGIIAGGGGCAPAIVLGKDAAARNTAPLALVGRVFCKVDADIAPIAIGDLLTSSTTPGHAMKVSDCVRAFGCVIGKALRPLTSGKGAIPVLVSLQ